MVFANPIGRAQLTVCDECVTIAIEWPHLQLTCLLLALKEM